MNRIKLIFFLFTILAISCKDDHSIPKPLGYYRIDFPSKEYVGYDGGCNFSFEYPVRSLLDTAIHNRPKCWMNLHYPQYSATLHITYSKIGDKPLNAYIEDSRKMAMKHIVKADDIQEKLINRTEDRVHGLAYKFDGNTATNYQFFVTDSNNHFLRGSLYFNLVPNSDSIEPVSEYIVKDIEHLIESIAWKSPAP
jgi:gliding motility-associated lipoprotein GldD